LLAVSILFAGILTMMQPDKFEIACRANKMKQY